MVPPYQPGLNGGSIPDVICRNNCGTRSMCTCNFKSHCYWEYYNAMCEMHSNCCGNWASCGGSACPGGVQTMAIEILRECMAESSSNTWCNELAAGSVLANNSGHISSLPKTEDNVDPKEWSKLPSKLRG